MLTKGKINGKVQPNNKICYLYSVKGMVFMKKLFAIAMLFLSYGATAQVTATAVLPTDGALLKEAEFDFGKIPQGKPVTHTFDVTNISNGNFKITNVQTSCGCTTPEWEKEKDILPGTSTKIKVGYNAASEGAFTKTITFFYADNKSKTITIKGEVWQTPNQSAPENTALNDLKF
jgi:hypothetical protein